MRSFCAVFVLVLGLAVTVSGCCPQVPYASCPICRNMLEEQHATCLSGHPAQARLERRREERCRPDNYRQPTCNNNGHETVDAETGACNGPPSPVWDYWRCDPVPPVPQNLIDNHGGQWCGEGALPQHARIWGVRMVDAAIVAHCLVFVNTPTRREWQDAYLFSVASYRRRMAELERRNSAESSMNEGRSEADSDEGGAVRIPPVPNSLVGGGRWCGETVSGRFESLYGPMNCSRNADGTNRCRSGCVVLDHTPNREEWERAYRRAVREALNFHRTVLFLLQERSRGHNPNEGRPHSGRRVLPDSI